MRKFALMTVAVGGLFWLAADVQAADGRNSFQLPQHRAVVASNGSTTVEATPVRLGYGWRGPGYYPGTARPYATYGYGYNNYNNYYRGGYGGYYGGYGNYYRGNPYYGYRGYGYYR